MTARDDRGRLPGIVFAFSRDARSNHPGGVNVGMLDGSVKFVRETVNLGTWGAIATRAGGEIISADQL